MFEDTINGLKYHVHDKVYYIDYDKDKIASITDIRLLVYTGYIAAIEYNAIDDKAIYYITKEDIPCANSIRIEDERLISKDLQEIFNRAKMVYSNAMISSITIVDANNNKKESKKNEECN